MRRRIVAGFLFVFFAFLCFEASLALSSHAQNASATVTLKIGGAVSTPLALGSSGNFRAQIENGAPFDIFLSADESYPQLVTDGLADAQSLVIYAQGHLVLWAPAGTNLRIAQNGFSALEDSRVVKIAIANPEHALSA